MLLQSSVSTGQKSSSPLSALSGGDTSVLTSGKPPTEVLSNLQQPTPPSANPLHQLLLKLHNDANNSKAGLQGNAPSLQQPLINTTQQPPLLGGNSQPMLNAGQQQPMLNTTQPLLNSAQPLLNSSSSVQLPLAPNAAAPAAGVACDNGQMSADSTAAAAAVALLQASPQPQEDVIQSFMQHLTKMHQQEQVRDSKSSLRSFFSYLSVPWLLDCLCCVRISLKLMVLLQRLLDITLSINTLESGIEFSFGSTMNLQKSCDLSIFMFSGASFCIRSAACACTAPSAADSGSGRCGRRQETITTNQEAGGQEG